MEVRWVTVYLRQDINGVFNSEKLVKPGEGELQVGDTSLPVTVGKQDEVTAHLERFKGDAKTLFLPTGADRDELLEDGVKDMTFRPEKPGEEIVGIEVSLGRNTYHQYLISVNGSRNWYLRK